MAFSTSKLVMGPVSAATGPIESAMEGPQTLQTIRRFRTARFSLQVRNVKEQNSQAPKALTAISRRDTILCLTSGSLSWLTLFSTEPVEARNVKSENRRKIMEKLKMQREKASKAKREDEKKEPPLPNRPFTLFPNPPKNLDGPLAEATTLP